jgi:hypothetical protein
LALTHQEIDARSLALYQLVAAKIRRDPELLERPKGVLARWRAQGPSRSEPYRMAWAKLLQQGLEPALALTVEDSEGARAMRQCSPFCGVLTPAERLAFLRSWAGCNAPRSARASHSQSAAVDRVWLVAEDDQLLGLGGEPGIAAPGQVAHSPAKRLAAAACRPVST